MNDKIQNLLMELVKECRKGKVAIVLSTVDSEMMEASSVLLAGSLPEQAIAFSELFEKFKEEALAHDCDCPECVAEKAEDAANEKSMDELLTAFLRGELQ
ncbi:hypothetical protein [Enterococcus faecalis]|uniref:hypothetical protein n=1 Tax=Enterococcus faecalis TaxID=1351 RepID=UPI0015604D7E|nr:hypothetical protein [Enterococcus faecalis]NRD99685.1 hypothetical protein [Enterococcus faecalis]NRE24915.1 hypothetical protein [Enterococcus faecalis]